MAVSYQGHPARVRAAACFTAAASLLAIAAAIPSPARAQVLLSDNFNSEPGALNYTGFANWNVSNGTVDTYSPYAGFGISVDMDGSSGNAGTLTSKTVFNLTPGDYTLNFALGKNGAAAETMTVSVGSAFSEVFANTGAIGTPQNIVRNFTVLSGTTGSIVFDHAGGDNEGFIIDNVSLVRNVVVAAPEPTSLALLAAGLLPVLGAVARNRRRQ